MSFISRFAPSTTGPAHPGTLLAALVAWLDARSNRGKLLLRFEDLDPQRSTPELREQLQRDFDWIGLDWDEVQIQSHRLEYYADALEALANNERLYPCTCSRKDVKAHGRRSPDGGWCYPNTCRSQPLPPGGWRRVEGALRIRLDDTPIVIQDESGTVIEQNPGLEMGDPIARRRDGAFGYNLSAIVDDELAGVNRIVRGRDLITSTPTHWAVQRLLAYPHPTYRHHFLFLENHQQKLAKFHGSVGAPELREHYTPQHLIGFIAFAAGLIEAPDPITASGLLSHFDWNKISKRDKLIEWTGSELICPDC